MKHQASKPGPGSPVNDLREKDLSRRKFLQSAGVAGMAAVTLPIAGIAATGPEGRRSNPEDPTEKILSSYGSEFGDLKKIR